MAEPVVGLLIGKLGAALLTEASAYGASLVGKEASALKGLFSEIRKAQGELEIMEAYLHDSEKFSGTNETIDIFIKKIRQLAFRIGDVVDEFMYKLEDDKHGRFISKVKKRIKHAKVWRRLTLELHSINLELEDAAKRRDRYPVPGMDGYAGVSDHHTRSFNQTACFARKEDLVGIEDNVDKLKRWLVGDFEENKNKIITVWGMGGAGKTTLVDHVYRIVKADFDTVAWVTVSKSYQVEDLLQKIVRELGISVDASNMELRSQVEVICDNLEGKRYMLVLDDVWEKDVWINIMDVFPFTCVNRFVLTSRKYEVASLATSNCVIKLEPLKESHSWQLFCSLAFRNDDDRRCPFELQDLAAKFLRKCEGLPLAIACIGRLLSCKRRTYSEWKNLYEVLELQSNRNGIPGTDIILKISLVDLPSELKNCFLHCAIFPEDFEMKRMRLIRHWISSGFIKDRENKTLEEVAEGYLNELVNRSLLQVVNKNEFGRVKSCRMHDVIRHVALDKAEKDCFGKVYEGCETFLLNGARRLSIQSANIAALSQSHSHPTHLRAIHIFTGYVDIDLLRPIIASSSLLSTLDLQGTQIKMLPIEVFSLFNLRFLGIRETPFEILPEGVGRLQNLEVLDAFGTALVSLPKGVSKLKKLRCLYACTLLTEGTLKLYRGIKVPRGIGNLTGLHALQDVKASLDTLCDVAALTKLRTFAVSDVKSEHSANLYNAIMNMSHLVHLSISASNENEVLPMEAICLPRTLSKLELEGQLKKEKMPQIVSLWSHLYNLTRLHLRFSKLDEESFSNLRVLRSLCYLSLSKAYDGKKLYFSAQSFPRLRRLIVGEALQLNQVEIAEGALESLAVLWFPYCPQLKSLPDGIEYLTSLEELIFQDTAEELIENLRQEHDINQCNKEFTKISHVRKVIVASTVKNIWERIH